MPIESPADGSKISRWLPFVSVANVDDAIAASTTAGGEVVVNARDVPLGRVAAIIDPQGAVLGLVRSAVGDPDDKTTAAAPGRAVWTELHTSDAVAATSFYKAVVGYDAKTIERRGGEFVVLGTHGRTDGGILQSPVEEWKPAWMTFFGVEDPAAAAELAVQLGGELLLAPSPDFRDGRIALVADPSGAVLVLRKWAIEKGNCRDTSFNQKNNPGFIAAGKPPDRWMLRKCRRWFERWCTYR